ncbi:MAG TPA: acetyl-CoA carboxylase biotin carboxylase subunit, partial [Flavisolibacter sp.]|nr:acetyl-CoA carboxylase biotin carboxylase subunit [Flavisolibacter sp.]
VDDRVSITRFIKSKMQNMRKILVANRGEIALRIMRTIRKMGLTSVAVFSDIDRNAPFVQYADEAVCLGGASSSESYLNGEKILAFAKQMNVDAIHPGYGFLSENAGFAEKVVEAGLAFIGPSAESMRVMGSKLAAKEAVKKYNIPMVPGLDKAVNDINTAKQVAGDLGYPVLIKASAGGGGKGIRVVEKEKDLDEQMQRAISEAQAAFGDGSVFIEKYIASPRHVEIQIIADNYGNTVYAFERECSVQRRHQKVVEETPSVIVSETLRQKMGEAAVMVAKACNYIGAGTVEFLMDEQRNFYFLEMNTRLQVEHPITEMITGLDLVEEQIRIARGERLRYTQDHLSITGHAIEFRVSAEDPLNHFLPSVGKLTKYEIPQGEGVRVDNGYEAGMEVPIYYDPLLAKLIVHAKTRPEAIQKIQQAIHDYVVEGVATTLPFGHFVFAHDAFLSGEYDTNFISTYYTPEMMKDRERTHAEAAALMALRHWQQQQKIVKPVVHKTTSWKRRLA